MTAHDPAKRAEAAVPVRGTAAPELREKAADGFKRGGGSWVPVKGPHLRVVRAQVAKNRTGVPGISYSSGCRPGGRPARYYYVNLGKTSRKFRIDTLGKELAWERALRCRAEHERKVRAANAVILQARQQSQR